MYNIVYLYRYPAFEIYIYQDFVSQFFTLKFICFLKIDCFLYITDEYYILCWCVSL